LRWASISKKIQQLSAAGGFTDAGQCILLYQRVDRAGFAGVRAPGESDFHALVGRRILQARRTVDELGLVIHWIHRYLA